MAFERVHVVGPVAAERNEPGVELLERLRLDAIQATLRVDAGLDEAGVAEDAEVLGDRGLRESQALLEFADGEVGVDEQGENRAAGGLGDDVEDGLHA